MYVYVNINSKIKMTTLKSNNFSKQWEIVIKKNKILVIFVVNIHNIKSLLKKGEIYKWVSEYLNRRATKLHFVCIWVF